MMFSDYQSTLPIAAVYLRPATLADAEAVYAWNFAPDVRAYSRTHAVPSPAEHAAWFAGRLRDAWSPIWIVEDRFMAVGVVRIDQISGVGRISIALAADARGRGVGRQAISSACTLWRRDVVAEIANDNAASRHCFEAAGFRAVERDGDVTIYQRKGT
ncbi:MAG TPA: GNAT family N-acetyltransferase [Kofleriaceae bacterium]|jgi:L-amino acid N-acyltransferase YncA